MNGKAHGAAVDPHRVASRWPLYATLPVLTAEGVEPAREISGFPMLDDGLVALTPDAGRSVRALWAGVGCVVAVVEPSGARIESVWRHDKWKAHLPGSVLCRGACHGRWARPCHDRSRVLCA